MLPSHGQWGWAPAPAGLVPPDGPHAQRPQVRHDLVVADEADAREGARPRRRPVQELPGQSGMAVAAQISSSAAVTFTFTEAAAAGRTPAELRHEAPAGGRPGGGWWSGSVGSVGPLRSGR